MRHTVDKVCLSLYLGQLYESEESFLLLNIVLNLVVSEKMTRVIEGELPKIEISKLVCSFLILDFNYIYTVGIILKFFKSSFINYFFLSGKSDVAFGSTLDRELLPLKVPPTRFGNQLRIPNAPNLGPGRYNNEEVSFEIALKCFKNVMLSSV